MCIFLQCFTNALYLHLHEHFKDLADTFFKATKKASYKVIPPSVPEDSTGRTGYISFSATECLYCATECVLNSATADVVLLLLLPHLL